MYKILIVCLSCLMPLHVSAAAKMAKLEASDKTDRVGIIRDVSSKVEWPSYNGSLDSQRYSPLDQITKSNIGQFGEYCSIEIASGGAFQAGPVFVDGVIYVTVANVTAAVKAIDCSILWRNEYIPTNYETYRVNRGVAYLNNRIFRGTTDGHLIALNAETGEVVWKNLVTDTLYGEFLTAAPVAWNGVVFIGTSGGDWGIRGRVMAFDTATGKELWRFNTIPRGSDVGSETWLKPHTAKTGGGASWTSYTIDIKENEIFIPVANPAPDLLPDYRPGDNLFTNSVVVLDATTGVLKWWYQSLKNDPWDHGMTAAPMLYRNNKGLDIVVASNKGGYLYFIDRDIKRPIFKVPVTTITNPIPAKPTPKGVVKCPGALGGIGWNGPAYDAINHAVVVGAADWCTNYISGDATYQQGRVFMGGDPKMQGEPFGWIRSVDAETGELRWKYKTKGAVIGGVLPTAGGLVFAGDTLGQFYAFDSLSGEVLFQKQLEGAVGGGVISYSLDSQQFVALATGNVSRASFGGGGVPTLIIMSLKGSPTTVNNKPSEKTDVLVGAADSGDKVYQNRCAVCHGANRKGGVALSLDAIGLKFSRSEIMNKIVNPIGAMPTLSLSKDEMEGVVTYLLEN